MKPPLLKINNLALSLGAKQILHAVSLDIFPAEYISIIGPNGAGKTSLLKCLMRLYAKTSGEIFIQRQPIEKYSQRKLARLISYVPQSDGRTFPFTVREFVLLGRYPYLSPFSSIRAEDRQAVQQALELSATTEFADRRLSTLSGGERQSVFIAAALAQGAEILLLDEPTTFLDPKHEERILTLLHTINKSFGKTIISVTHNINNAVFSSDRIVALKNGKIQFDGPASDVMNNKILETTFDKQFNFARHPMTGSLFILPEVANT